MMYMLLSKDQLKYNAVVHDTELFLLWNGALLILQQKDNILPS